MYTKVNPLGLSARNTKARSGSPKPPTAHAFSGRVRIRRSVRLFFASRALSPLDGIADANLASTILPTPIIRIIENAARYTRNSVARRASLFPSLSPSLSRLGNGRDRLIALRRDARI